MVGCLFRTRVLGLLIALFFSLSVLSGQVFAARTAQPAPLEPPADLTDALGWVNFYRALAGVPPVVFDEKLNQNCQEHALYMVMEDDITHYPNPQSAWYTRGANQCARNGNVWLGNAWSSAPIDASTNPRFLPEDSVTDWMSSVGHRLWLLYPTTKVFGYGFYSHQVDEFTVRAGAALDVASRMASDSRDRAYRKWPVIYPAVEQTNVPRFDSQGGYPITLMWRYFGPKPVVNSTQVRTENGSELAHTVETTLPGGHKGILIFTNEPLPPQARITVTVNGSYARKPFTYSWSFVTGD